MRYTKLYFPVLLLLVACSNNLSGQDSSQTTLPDSAIVFIQKFFPSDKLIKVSSKKSPTADGTFYEAKLASGTEIDFGKTGNWIELKAGYTHSIPTHFFPASIKTYLESNFTDTGVKSIDREPNGYEIELDNDINLFFDLNGSFVKQEK